MPPHVEADWTYDGGWAATHRLFAVNRDQHEPLALDVDVRSLPNLAIGEHVALFDNDPAATNTVDRPDRVTPTRLADVKPSEGTVPAVLPALSWNMIRLRTA